MAKINTVELTGPAGTIVVNESDKEAYLRRGYEPIESDADDSDAGDGDYSGLNKDQLKAELDSRGVEYQASANKADLVAALEADDADTE